MQGVSLLELADPCENSVAELGTGTSLFLTAHWMTCIASGSYNVGLNLALFVIVLLVHIKKSPSLEKI